MITPFYRHGILSNSTSMNSLVEMLRGHKCVGQENNEDYCWRDSVVKSGLRLADTVLTASNNESVLLVGHSQGGLVCRMAAVALLGRHRPQMRGPFTKEIEDWQHRNRARKFSGKLGVVTIATPNAGAVTCGQMSVAGNLAREAVMEVATRMAGCHNVEDLTTPRLFEEFENWNVGAKYLSISGVCVNRYRRGWIHNLAELWPIRRVSVRFDVPNDLVVEDSSTDLRESVIRPEVDLDRNYKHVRAYPTSISLDHFTVRESPEVAKVVLDNLRWLFDQRQLFLPVAEDAIGRFVDPPRVV